MKLQKLGHSKRFKPQKITMTPLSHPTTHPLAQLSLLAGQHRIAFADIVFIEGQRNYTSFHTRHGQRILSSKSLSFYRDKLPAQLLRIHKSYFVNTLFIKAFDKESVHLTGGQRLPVSRRRRREVEQWIDSRFVF